MAPDPSFEHALPPAIAARVWRGSELGEAPADTLPTGWPQLDEGLVGGGWPYRSVTEVLAAQPATLEWRLLAPALRRLVERKRQIVVIGPPREPCMVGLEQEGIDEGSLVWIRAERPAERLWAAEQVIRSSSAGAVLAWLPQVRAEQIRRLQVSAQGASAPVFLFRNEMARREASPSPLRVSVTLDPDWALSAEIFKRPGLPIERPIRLSSIPAALRSTLTARLRRPSVLPGGQRANIHALGLPVAASRERVAANAA